MKKVSLYIIAILLMTLFTATILTGCSPFGKIKSNKKIDLSNMSLVFEDDFNGDLDKSVWKTTFENPIRRGGYWTEEQTFTDGGNLIIRTEYKENGSQGSGWYTGTCLSQDLKEFTYGYFEVRCKAPAAQGLWSAFWLQGTNMAKICLQKTAKPVRKSI